MRASLVYADLYRLGASGMSADSGWVQREMRLMSDKDRDAYILRSRISYNYIIAVRAAHKKYKQATAAFKSDLDEELKLLDNWRTELWEEYNL